MVSEKVLPSFCVEIEWNPMESPHSLGPAILVGVHHCMDET